MRNIIRYMAIALLPAVTSCEHKDLCYQEMQKSKIMVAYDWSDAPEASPDGMCVFFYSTTNPDEYYRFDFDNIRGGEVEIPAGRYVVITYNNDTEAVRFSGSNIFEGHKAYTRDGDLLEPLYGNGVTGSTKPTDGERVCITPDELWGTHATDVMIDRHGVTYTVSHFDDSRAVGDQTITLYPHDLLCHYSYEVRNVENVQNISKISASISGMSGAMNLADESIDSENVTLPVEGKAEADSAKITGQFLTFGHNGNGTVSHKMAFFVVMNDGSKYRIEGNGNLDVSSQVDNAPDKRHVHIIIDGLRLPDSTAGDEDGWNPTVDDWGVEREDLKI